MVQNKSLLFKAIPETFPEKGKHLNVEDVGFDLDAAPPQDGIVLKNIYSSFDPYMRGRMRDPKIPSYFAAFQVGEPITSLNIAEVVKSSNSKFKEGDVVRTFGPIQEYYARPGSALAEGGMESVTKLENPLGLDVKEYLGALGMPGTTAYSSFYEIGKPKKGETIFVSAASGAVGALVGQLAKHEGLTVIGSVGDDSKLDYIVNELGFDAGFNYKKETPEDAIKRLAPNGLDIYYENVGGETLQAAFDAMNNHGRIIVCGMIAQYNVPTAEQIPLRNVTAFIWKRLVMRGFLQGDPEFGPKWGAEHQKNMGKWIKEGSFQTKTHVTKGIDSAAEGLIGIFKGENFGKAVLDFGSQSGSSKAKI